jgi:hypothetical protein
MRPKKPKTKGDRAVAGPATIGSEGSPQSEVVLYEAADGSPGLEVRLERDTVWLSQAQMADLFQRERSVITKHLGNVFREGELGREGNVQNVHFAGSDKPVALYNLDVIISVGYRIKSTVGGAEVYPSLEEKAAHLLYFLTKNHHFVDGNKRIAAALFLWFLEKNGALYRPDGTKRIADNALVAMTLLIAESRPEEKGVLVRVVVNLINRRNP